LTQVEDQRTIANRQENCREAASKKDAPKKPRKLKKRKSLKRRTKDPVVSSKQSKKGAASSISKEWGNTQIGRRRNRRANIPAGRERFRMEVFKKKG